MAEHSDVQRFRNALEARSGGPPGDEMNGLFADEVIWHGTADGRDEVLAHWTGDGPGISVTEVYADGLHTVAVLERTGAGGQTAQQGMVFHVDNGQVTDIWSLPADRAIADAFAAGEAVAVHGYMEVFEIAEATRERNTFEPDDIAKIHAFLREDVEWHGAGTVPGVKGRDTVIGLYKQFKAATGGSMHLGMGAKFIDGSHAVSIVHLTATRADNPERKMDVMEVNLFHLDENGHAFEFWGVPADQEEMDAFWLP